MKNEMIFFEQDLISEIFEGVENPFDELAGEVKNKLVKSLSGLVIRSIWSFHSFMRKK